MAGNLPMFDSTRKKFKVRVAHCKNVLLDITKTKQDMQKKKETVNEPLPIVILI